MEKTGIKLKAKAQGSDFVCQVCRRVSTKPVYCLTCYNKRSILRFFCRDCYIPTCVFAKYLVCDTCKTVTPPIKEVDKEMRDYLNKYTYNCPNYCLRDDVNYSDLVKHMKGEECNGFRYGDRELKNIEERIKTIKKEDRWLDITEDKIYLKEDWDPYNAKCLICLYLSDLEGYICYQCTALGCKQCIEDYDKSVHFSVASCFHPHGYRLCPHCKKYGMVKLDRFPEAHDKVQFFT